MTSVHEVSDKFVVMTDSKHNNLIFHSDCGSQYCSETDQVELKRFNIQPSMSRKGDCWDNAPTES